MATDIIPRSMQLHLGPKCERVGAHSFLKNNHVKSKRGGARPGAGRKKGVPNKATADVKAAAQKFTVDALDTLASIMKASESDAARVAAAKELLDRGHGKSPQAITGEGGGPVALAVSWQPPSE